MKNKSHINFLDITAKNDNKRLCLLSIDHLNKLKSLNTNPLINKLYSAFSIQNSEFINNYANWVVAEYSYRHELNKLNGLIDDLSCLKLSLWEKKIHDVFSRRTKQYKDIFSGVIKPPLDGNPSVMLDNLKLLLLNLKKYYKLKFIQKDINNYINLIEESQLNVQKKIDDSKKAILVLDVSRKKIIDMIFINFSSLSDKLSHNKSSFQIADFFNLNLVNS